MLSCSGGWVDAFLVVFFLAGRGWVVAGVGGGPLSNRLCE